jgi:hypothetical protein
MLIKLPILINNKNSNLCFRIIIDKNLITIKPYNYDKNNIKVICSSNYGIYDKSLMFPLKFEIIGKYLFNELFFYLCMTKRNENDFFYLLLKCINKKINVKYPDLKFLVKQINIQDNIIQKYNNKYNYKNNFKSVTCFLNFTFYRAIFLFNYYLFLNYCKNNNIIFLTSKKQNTIVNYINNLKLFYNGRESTLEELIYMINNNDNVNFGNKMKHVFLTNNDMTLSFNINNKNIKNLDSKLKITYFPKVTCSINNLFEQIMIFYELKIIKKLINKLYKNNNYYCEFIEYYYKDNKYDYLTYLKLLNINIENKEDEYKNYLGNQINITQDELSYDFFKNIVIHDNNFNENILKKLLVNYLSYPLINNKTNIDVQYKKILFYSNKFINYINKLNLSSINTKTKNLYLMFIDFFYNIKNNNNKYFTNIKIYQNNLFLNILKIILFDDNFLNIKEKYKKEFIKNYSYYNICSVLKQENLKFYYDYVKYIYDLNIHDNNNYKDYLNNKLRKKLNNPISFLSNTFTFYDFQNWINIIKNNIESIFYQNIVLSDDDYNKISKLLFYGSKILKNNDDNYNKFIKYSAKNYYIVIYENHINIRLNEILKKNLNYGILLRDINNYIEVSNIISDIDKYKSKYYKYKTKYLLGN